MPLYPNIISMSRTYFSNFYGKIWEYCLTIMSSFQKIWIYFAYLKSGNFLCGSFCKYFVHAKIIPVCKDLLGCWSTLIISWFYSYGKYLNLLMLGGFFTCIIEIIFQLIRKILDFFVICADIEQWQIGQGQSIKTSCFFHRDMWLFEMHVFIIRIIWILSNVWLMFNCLKRFIFNS